MKRIAIRNIPRTSFLTLLLVTFILFGLYLTSFYSYLLFHSLAELSSVAIAVSVFLLVWYARRYMQNDYLLFIGIASLFVGGLDAIHMLAYRGMGVFQGYDANLPTQLWIAARYLLSLSLLIAPLFFRWRLNPKIAFTGFTLTVTLLLASIFYWNIFPACYVEGMGLTPFKITSEYVISLILLASIALLFRNRKTLDPAVFQPLIFFIVATIGAELAFTSYIGVYDLANFIGHIFKIISYLILARALVVVGLMQPYDLLFRDLKQNRDELQVARNDLELRVRQRTAELAKASERYINTLDNMLEGCQLIGFDWRYLYVNNAAARQGRKTKEEFLGHTMVEIYPGIENTAMFAAMRRCMDERAPVQMENEFTYPDGAKGWFELSIQPVPEGVFTLSVDITERKRAEMETVRRLQNIQALQKIDQTIAGSLDLNLTLDVVLEQTKTELNVDAAAILLFNPHTQILEFAAGVGFRSKAIERSRLRLGEGHGGRVALERKTVSILNLLENIVHFVRAPLLADEGLVTYFGTPLIAKGQVKGVLEVFHRTPFIPNQDWLDFLEVLAGQTAIAVDSASLFADLQNSNVKLFEAYNSTIEGWSHALDLRDKETEGHTQRVTEMTLKLACAAEMTEEELVHVRRGALLHDIGKMGVPDHILLKPGKLTDEEWVSMRKHPTFAFELLSPIAYLRPALDIPYCHHEKWDGSGYPRGLKGEQIPLAARLFAVIDVWDALRSDRPYRQGWPEEKVLEHIRSLSGTHFDPKAVELFLRMVSEKT